MQDSNMNMIRSCAVHRTAQSDANRHLIQNYLLSYGAINPWGGPTHKTEVTDDNAPIHSNTSHICPA